MKPPAVFAALMFMAAGTAAAATLALTDPLSATKWFQNSDGVVRNNETAATRAKGETVIRVYSADGAAPVRGALAWWIAPDAGVPLFSQSTLVADDKGNLRVPLVAGLHLRVWAPGFEVVEHDSAEVASLHELALWPGAAATLRVGAERVQLKYFIGARAAQRELSAATDASGAIAWPGTPAEGVRVEVVDPRFVLTGLTLHAGDKREIALQPARRVVARIVDDDGRPLAKAKARSFVAIGPAPNDVRRLEWTSDDDGRITLQSLPAGEQVVEFGADGFVSKSLRVSAPTQTDLGDVQLRRGSPFVLVVRGDEGPIENARVFLEDGERLSSDRSGRVAIAGLDVRQQPRLRVAANDYLAATIDVRSGMKSPYELQLRRGSGFRFRLLDGSTGDPVPHARIRVHTTRGWFDRDLDGPRGEYFAAGINGTSIQLRVRAAGYLPLSTSAELSATTTDLGVLFLSRGAELSGVLVNVRDGRPIAGAHIETVPPSERGTMAARLFGETIKATTDADGRFALSGLDGGTLCATVNHPSIGEVPLPLGTVAENSPRDIGVISLGDSTTVEGTLHDSEGAPVADANVELRFGPVFNPCMSLASTLDDKGSYHFDRVAPGPYHLVALRNHEVLATRAIVVRSGEVNHEDLEIRTVSVHGTVVIRDLPAGGGSVMLERTGTQEFTPPTIFFSYVSAGVDPRQRPVTDIIGKTSFTVGQDGAFAGKARLDAGDYEVVWTPADNSAWYHSWISLSEGVKTLDVALRFKGVPLPGRASAPDGSALAGAFIRLIDQSGRVHRSTVAAPDGSFVLPQVPSGRWIVEGAGRGLTARQTVDVEDKPVEALRLMFTPKETSRLTVQIGNDPDASVVDTVLVTNANGIVRMAKANPSATFVDLPPGAYKIFALDEHGGIVAGDVVSAGASSTTVTLSARPTRNVVFRCKSAEPGERVTLLRDRYSLSAVLAYEGLTLTVLDDGSVALPPLSDGTWTIRIGDRSHDIAVSRDDRFDLDE